MKGREILAIPQPFKVSTGLKDLIGQDLITNDFVAVFELVKNSFDAHASTVRLLFEEERIVITDNGKGMSRADILDKWLFVAYSAKSDGTEDEDYRHGISRRTHTYAGSKGVGRFSCDRLGKRLLLSSCAGQKPVQLLDIDWSRFEQDPKQEFGEVTFNLSEAKNFPDVACKPDCGTGTVLEISELRSTWDRKKLLVLKRELAKLINPFAIGPPTFQIQIVAPAQQAADEAEAGVDAGEDGFPVNGNVENRILEALRQRTTAIRISIVDDGGALETTVEDRGENIYQIRESNPYERLESTDLKAEVYYLNQSAKTVFARRMGLRSVEFGSIFLFRNGFRVFPIGQEQDDFFGLAHRKQQGTRRFLGTRDLVGCVQIRGAKGFDEATSRDQGLIRTPEVEELIDCIRDKCVRRLERYVVDITWKDKTDNETEDTSRMRIDESSARIGQLVSRLAATKGVELLKYNPDLVRIVDEKSAAFESSFKALELLAEKTGDQALLSRVEEAAATIKELRTAEAEARQAEIRAESRAAAAEVRYSEERERNRFLVAAASLDQDTILNLHHQIFMYASDVHIGIRRRMGKLRKGALLRKEEWIDFLQRVSYRNSQIMTASRFATKGGYKQQSTEVEADLAVYVHDYVTTISALWAPRGVTVEVHGDGKKFERGFRPIEVGIVIDNLVSNAGKARAAKIGFFLEVSKGPKPVLSITVADDGAGWPVILDPVSGIFDKGVTTTDGSGLGLYHVKQVIERLGGAVEAVPKPYSKKFGGAQIRLKVPS